MIYSIPLENQDLKAQITNHKSAQNKAQSYVRKWSNPGESFIALIGTAHTSLERWHHLKSQVSSVT